MVLTLRSSGTPQKRGAPQLYVSRLLWKFGKQSFSRLAAMLRS